jgi:hypothetical protein
MDYERVVTEFCGFLSVEVTFVGQAPVSVGDKLLYYYTGTITTTRPLLCRGLGENALAAKKDCSIKLLYLLLRQECGVILDKLFTMPASLAFAEPNPDHVRTVRTAKKRKYDKA